MLNDINQSNAMKLRIFSSIWSMKIRLFSPPFGEQYNEPILQVLFRTFRNYLEVNLKNHPENIRYQEYCPKRYSDLLVVRPKS